MNESQTFSLITNSISNFGFPIVLTTYLLLRFEKKIDSLNNSILELIKIMQDGVKNKKL